MPLVKNSGFEAPEHFRIRPLSLDVTSGMGNRSKANLAVGVLNVLHEGAAHELRTVIGDDSVWHTEMAD